MSSASSETTPPPPSVTLFTLPCVVGLSALPSCQVYSFDRIFILAYYLAVAWDVEFTDEFGTWWDSLSPEEQESVDFGVGLLIERGPTLPFPYSSQVKGSRFGEMRELRVQHLGKPYRVLYAFDPLRTALHAGRR